MNERLRDLRARMLERGIDAYLAFSSDYHASEYLSAYFKVREYLSGFTGSAGTLAVTMEEAALFTDGRYFLQAERELKGSGIALMRQGERDVPSLEQYLKSVLPPGALIATDGRTISAAQGEAFISALGAKLYYEEELARWPNRPPLPNRPVYGLPLEYTGMDAHEKLFELRQVMTLEGATAHLLTTLDDIAWLFNLRGGDVRHTPVALAYAYITMERALLFIDAARVDDALARALGALGVELLPYDAVYKLNIGANERVLIDKQTLNYTLFARVGDQATPVCGANPTRYRKAQKNAAEIANAKNAHEWDGAAVVKLLHWLQTRLAEGARLTEYDVASKADAFRAQCGDCIGPSFDTIAGYAQNGAVVHYLPKKDTALTLQARGMLLLDSGGQYRSGTTDLTRTVALGPVSGEMKRHYTLVLKGLIAFSSLRFPRGMRGDQLDAIARAPLWRDGLDYNHGTGHGIGSFLCVHEPPVVVNWRRRSCTLRPGMVLSDEPGQYVENSHGVRLESQLLVCEDTGGFLRFDTLTLVPFDRRLIDASLLSAREIRLINTYHARVYQTLAPLLEDAPRAWLRAETLPVI